MTIKRTTKRRALPRSADEIAALKQAIIDRLQSSGETITACTQANSVPLSTLYRWRNEDRVFKIGLKDAYDAGTDVLEQEAIRRGLHGVEKPVFYQGEICGHIREYSDIMLMFVLKKRNPAFRENTPGLDARDPIPTGAFYIDATMLDAFSPQLLKLLQQEAEEIERKRVGGGISFRDVNKRQRGNDGKPKKREETLVR